jgi:hyperosmotically inducible protein
VLWRHGTSIAPFQATAGVRYAVGGTMAHQKEASMNSRLLKLTAIMGALVVGAACSATRTQQSAGEVIDDSVLTAKVKAELIDDPITKAGQINVETYRGVVQLGGFVDNAQQKDQATKVARSVTGVKEVRNDLRVSSPQATAGQVIDDGTVTASVKTKLIDDSTTKAHQINVETQKGVVQLTGFVNSNEAKARAGELARSVDGVVEVRNDLEIRQK